MPPFNPAEKGEAAIPGLLRDLENRRSGIETFCAGLAEKGKVPEQHVPAFAELMKEAAAAEFVEAPPARG